MKGVGQGAAYARGLLRAGPDGQRPTLPLGHRRSRLHRRVSHVGDFITGLVLRLGRGQSVLDRVGGPGPTASTHRVRFEVGEQFLARRVRRSLPGRVLVQRFDGLSGPLRGGSGAAHEVAVANDNHIAHRSRGCQIDGLERRAERHGAEHFAVEHAGAHDVGRIAVFARDQIRRLRFGCACAQDPPLADRRDGCPIARRLLERCGQFVVSRQFFVANGAIACRIDDSAVACSQPRAIRLPPLRGQVDEGFARGRSTSAHARNRARRRPTAGGASVVGHEGRIGHHQSHAIHRHAQFLGRGLGQLGARALAHFDLAGHDRDHAVGSDVKPLVDRDRTPPRTALSHAVLGGPGRNEQARAENLHKPAPAKLERVGG